MIRPAQTADADQLESLDDAALVDRALNASTERDRERAFNVLYSRRNPGLLRWLTSQQNLDNDKAQDVAASAWDRVFRHLHRFDPDRGKFRSWLWYCAKNLVRNAWRDRSRDPTVLETELEARQPGEDSRGFFAQTSMKDGPNNRVSTPIPAPEETLAGRELERVILDALDELKEHHAVVIRLRRKGLAYEQIAEQVGVPEGTIKSRLTRARTQLSDAMAERGVDVDAILNG